MKKLALCAMMLACSMFLYGCTPEKKKTPEPAKNGAADTTKTDGGGTTTTPEGGEKK